jgi:hypothetical protein
MSNSPSNYALTVLGEKENAPAVAFSKLQSVAIQQLGMIQRLERDAALRAILVGLALHRIKAALKHGDWQSWIDANVQGAGRAQCRFYMRLAIRFVEKTRATKPEILALPGDQGELAIESAEGAARRLMDKAVKFVADRSLNQLLSDLGIKDRKADKLRKLSKDEAADAAEDAPAPTLQESFNTIEEHLRIALAGALDRATWMSFSRQQHEDLRHIFEQAAGELRERFLKTHPQRKEDSK